MIGLRLEPVDTWFFRDGTPFTMGSSPQENVTSVFPPPPATVVGALRAALALEQGWNGRGPWPSEIREVLGDGPDDMGKLRFEGPFLLRCDEPLFPAPRHLLGARGGAAAARWRPRGFLRPGEPVDCDLGRVRLPAPFEAADEVESSESCGPGNAGILPASDEANKSEPATECWLTLRGMTAIIDGRLPKSQDVVGEDDLWSEEPRIGLERERGSRTAKEGMLYSTRHIRLRRGISLGVRIAGLPGGWSLPLECLLTLGGESRLAACREWRVPAFETRKAPELAGGRLALIAFTPLDLEVDVCLGRQPLRELGSARVISACFGRALRVGGWDSRPGRGPLPMRSVLAPGSVLFCEGLEANGIASRAAKSEGLVRIGRRTESGFGLAALARWP